MTRPLRRRGNAMIETAMFIPLFVLLLMGTAEVARVTYVYYQVQKALYGIARLAGTRNGAYLCDSADPEFLTIKNFVLAGNSEGGEPLISGLSPELVQVRMERREAGSDILGECECSLEGCDAAQGGRSPDFIVVSVPDGFQVNVTIPYLLQQVVVFRPTVRVPYGAA
jgi:hypothetical protein